MTGSSTSCGATSPPPSAHHLLHVYVSRLRALLRRVRRMGSASSATGPGYALASSRTSWIPSGSRMRIAEPGRSPIDDPEAAERILAHGDAALAAELRSRTSRSPRRPYASTPRTWSGCTATPWAPGSTCACGSGATTSSCPSSPPWLADQPYDEALHAQLMLALYRCGRQAEALATARALEARLRDDLGIDPSPEVRDLYRDILLQASHLIARAARATRQPAEPADLVRGPDARAPRGGRAPRRRAGSSPLTGPGGIGKTRLAIEVAAAAAVAVPRRRLVGRPGAGDRARHRRRPAGRRPRRGADAGAGLAGGRRPGARPAASPAAARQLRARGGGGRGAWSALLRDQRRCRGCWRRAGCRSGSRVSGCGRSRR